MLTSRAWRDGAFLIDLWCNSVQGQLVVAAGTITVRPLPEPATPAPRSASAPTRRCWLCSNRWPTAGGKGCLGA